MRSVHHLTASDTRRVPWKNGRGVTEELAVWPFESAFERGDFDWRISKARVAEAGPFSNFHEFDRILVVTSGDGLVLSHGERAARVRVRKFEPYRFRGDWPTTAELVSGAVDDFNVLVRRDAARADVQVTKLGRRRARETVAAGHAFVHVLAGSVVARVGGEEEPFELATLDSLWIESLEREDELDLAGASDDLVLALVRIEDARPH